MEKEAILENAMAAISGAAEIVPKKWANVRSLHLKSLESVALPIYQTVPDMPLKIEGFKKEVEEVFGAKPADNTGAVKEKEKGSEKKKKASKKGRIHEVRYLDSDMDELMAGAVDNDNGDAEAGSGGEELLDRKNKKKRKKVTQEEEINGRHSDVIDSKDGSEQNDDEVEVAVDKKMKKKKKAEELDNETPKKTSTVKKGRNDEVIDGVLESDGVKRKSKAGKLQDKEREVKKKACKKVK